MKLRATAVAAAIAAATLGATEAAAVPGAATGVMCAAGVTTGLGERGQRTEDLEPAHLPVLPYAAAPAADDGMTLMRVAGVPIRLYVYRVTDTLLHMQIFEESGGAKGVLADTPLSGDMGELTWRTLGGNAMVTAYCY